MFPWAMFPRQATPVTVEIIFRIKKDKKTKNNPRTAKVKVLRAPSTALASPPENNNWYPAKIIINKATVPASPMAQKITLKIKGKMQSSVAT